MADDTTLVTPAHNSTQVSQDLELISTQEADDLMDSVFSDENAVTTPIVEIEMNQTQTVETHPDNETNETNEILDLVNDTTNETEDIKEDEHDVPVPSDRTATVDVSPNTNTDGDGDQQKDTETEHEGEGGMMGGINAAIASSKYSKRECGCFFSFLIVFTVMAILGRGNGDIAYTQTVSIRLPLINKDEFVPWNDVGEKVFDDASTHADVWLYLRDIAFPLLFNDESGYYVQSQQALMGGMRLKQLRLAPEKCDRSEFREQDCYSFDYDTSSVEFNDSSGNIETWKYEDSDELDDQSWRGKYGTYPGEGYVEEFNMKKLTLAEALTRLTELEDMDWIDGGTRFVSLDFVTYNPSTYLHTVGRLAWEMPTGGVLPNDEIKTWKFDRYAGLTGSALAFFHVLFGIYIFGMTLMMIYDMYTDGCLKCGGKSYWRTKWRALDVGNLVIFYITIIFYAYNESYRSDFDLFDRENGYISYRALQYTFTLESYTKAVNGALLWFKLFKYFSINKRLRFLFTMLSKSGEDLLMFLIILTVFFLAFGTAGFLTFNSDVDDFRSYFFSMGNMLRFVIVDMDYDALTLSSRTWGSFFYFAWSILMLLILANVFIAILTDAYAAVKLDFNDDDDFHFAGAFKSFAGKLTTKFRRDLKQRELDADGDGQLSPEELAVATGISVEEAVEIIEKYDVDGDGQLNEEEFEVLKEKILEDKEREEQMKSRRRQKKPQHAGQGMMMGLDGVSSMEFDGLKKDVDEIRELLIASLGVTASGKKAIKKLGFKSKKGQRASEIAKHARRDSMSIRQSSNGSLKK